MKTRIGVDTGGTFTDLVLLDSAGALHVHKVRSTPDDPSRAVLAGVRELLGNRRANEVIHGSTVATNALLERKGARIAFLTTAGFEHILHIRRQTRTHLYRLSSEERTHLVEDDLLFGVNERIGAYGEIIEPLTDAEITRLTNVLVAIKPEAIALCLLHAYAFPQHEQRLAEALRNAGLAVSTSHEILPEHREFERAATTAVNAYVSPKMDTYLTNLVDDLPADILRITQSAGGFVSAEEARREAVQTVLSGPAGGAVGALAIAQASGFPRVIAFDMGGTSTDVTLLDNALPTTAESVISGFPIRLSTLDIHTVGAGGGSIAFVDPGGSLRVGPRSAGAVPGPACYGSGSELTVTDANLLLGRLDPEFFLGGRMQLDPQCPQKLARELALRLDLTPGELAEGIIRIANSNIERALRVVSVQRGYDPRDFALLAFGGAGGMHACDLASALDIQTVLVPQHAGILSALGMLLADYIRQYSKAVLRHADAITAEEFANAFHSLEESARAELANAGFTNLSTALERSLDVRYYGQSYELTVPFSGRYRNSFDQLHQQLYGYHNPHRTCEVVNLRVKAIGFTSKPAIPRRPLTNCAARSIRNCSAIFNNTAISIPLYARESLLPGMFAAGPAIIAGADATTVVPPDWQFTLDSIGTLLLTRK